MDILLAVQDLSKRHQSDHVEGSQRDPVLRQGSQGLRQFGEDTATESLDRLRHRIARIRAALRHRLASVTGTPLVRHGDVEIDLAGRLVHKGGVEVHLTPKEYGFLEELARNAGRVVTHAHLLRTVWGPGHDSDVEYLRVAARGIRRKLEDDPTRPLLIRNEPGVGYRLVV